MSRQPKVAFFLQRRFASIGHAIACNLQKYHGFKSFCGVVSMRASYDFLKKQKDVAYSSLLLDQDIHARIKDEQIDYEFLKKLEDDYGIPNLWPYLYIDRIVMHSQLIREYPHDEPLYTHEEMLKLLQVYAKAVLDFYEKEQPDVLVISVVGSLLSSLLYFIAKKKGIKTLNIDLIRINTRVALSEDYRSFTWAQQVAEELAKTPGAPARARARAYINQFRKTPESYHEQFDPKKNRIDRLSHLTFLRPALLIRSISWYGGQLFKNISRTRPYDFDEVRTWSLVWDKMCRKARGLRGFDDLYSLAADEPFAFYPLHYDPEIATMLLAPHYTNQLEVIRQIARSLPVGYKLYVKEHIMMTSYRNRSFYRQITKIPNVKLIDPHVRGFDLAKKAKIVLTISGTVGWEACLLGTPVITFGDVYYNQLSFVRRCHSYEDLAALVQERINNFSFDENELESFVAALFEESVDVDYYRLWLDADSDEEIIADEGMKRLSALVAKKIDIVTRT